METMALILMTLAVACVGVRGAGKDNPPPRFMMLPAFRPPAFWSLRQPPLPTRHPRLPSPLPPWVPSPDPRRSPPASPPLLLSPPPRHSGLKRACTVTYDSCDGSFSPGGDCPSSLYTKLNGVARAISIMSAGSRVATLNAPQSMHLPAFMNTLGVRKLIMGAIDAANMKECGVVSRTLYTGAAIAARSSCTQTDLSDDTYYLSLAGTAGGFPGCVALDAVLGLIPVNANGVKLDIFKSAISGYPADELPTQVFAPLDAFTWSLTGIAPMRDISTGGVQGSAKGHISFRGPTATRITVPAASWASNGTSSVAIDFDPAGDGVGSPDHAVALTLIGGPVISFGTAAHQLDLSDLTAITTQLRWTFLSASDYSMEFTVAGSGLTLSTLLSRSSFISSYVLQTVAATPDSQTTLTANFWPQAWQIKIVLSSPVALLATAAEASRCQSGEVNVIQMSGSRSSSAVGVATSRAT